MRAGRATTKGSCARNLHRLMLVITFVRLLLQQLLDSPSTQLKDALWVAYKVGDWVAVGDCVGTVERCGCRSGRSINLRERERGSRFSTAARRCRASVWPATGHNALLASWTAGPEAPRLRYARFISSTSSPPPRPARPAYPPGLPQGSLHPIHTYMVQTAVWAGLGMVPSRAAFMASIGEDEDSARQHVPEVLAAAAELAGRLERMYGGTVMPASDLTYIPAAPAAAGATM